MCISSEQPIIFENSPRYILNCLSHTFRPRVMRARRAPPPFAPVPSPHFIFLVIAFGSPLRMRCCEAQPRRCLGLSASACEQMTTLVGGSPSLSRDPKSWNYDAMAHPNEKCLSRRFHNIHQSPFIPVDGHISLVFSPEAAVCTKSGHQYTQQLRAAQQRGGHSVTCETWM